MFQRKSTNNISTSSSSSKIPNKIAKTTPAKLVTAPNLTATKKFTTKSSIAISSSSKLKSFTSHHASSSSFTSNDNSTVGQGIFRQRTNLSIASYDIQSSDSTFPIDIHKPLRKRSRSNIEIIHTEPIPNGKPLRSKTAILTPKSTRLPDPIKKNEQNSHSTLSTPIKSYDTKLLASKKKIEKKSLETQLLTKRKHYNYEKGRLLTAQTQVLNLCKTIEELQTKLNQLSATDIQQQNLSEPIEKLKLVAYQPDANHFYVCKDSATTFAAIAEQKRLATIDHFRQSLASISDELQHQHNIGFDACNNIIQEMCKCFMDLKKGRPFEIDLYTKKMQMTLKDIENSLVQQRQCEYDRLHLVLTKCEKMVLGEIISTEDRKKLSSPAAAILADGDHIVDSNVVIENIDSMTETLKTFQLNATEKTKEIVKLQCDLDEAKKIIQQNQFTTTTNHQQIDELKMELDDIKDTLRQANEQITENDTIIAELNNDNQELRKQLQTIDHNDKLSDDNIILSDNTNTRNNLNEIKIDDGKINESIDMSWKKKYINAKLQLKQERQTIIIYQRLMNVRSELINSMQAKESLANCQLKDLRSEIDTNNLLFDRMKSELMEKGDELKQFNDELMKKDQDIVQLRNANNQLRKQFQEIMGFSKL